MEVCEERGSYGINNRTSKKIMNKGLVKEVRIQKLLKKISCMEEINKHTIIKRIIDVSEEIGSYERDTR